MSARASEEQVGGIRTAVSILCLFNLTATAAFFVGFRWQPSVFTLAEGTHQVEKIFVVATGTVLILASLAGRTRALSAVFSVQVGCSTLVLALLALEVWAGVAPAHLPQSILRQRPELAVGPEGVEDVLEYLPDSPWVKFKPNRRVHSVGFRGGDFTEEWTTDSLGFKNARALAATSPLTAVAVGDSFVEGMGAAVQDVWTSVVTAGGFPVYSLGVQGYAPQQMVGSLERYGARFHPRVVIVGYTPGFESRALLYAEPSSTRGRRRAAGGLAQITQYMEDRRKLVEHFKMTNTVVSMAEELAGVAVTRAVEWNQTRRSKSVMERYRGEVETQARLHFDPASPEWELTKTSILEIKRFAQSIEASPVVLLFAHRSLVYYEMVMGHAAPSNHYERETAEAVRVFCREQNIDLIETFGPLNRYVKSLPSDAGPSRLPYWESDGHMSVVGNKIVADLVLDYLRSKS